MIDPAAQQGPLAMGREDLQQALQGLVRQDEGIRRIVKRGDSHQGHRDGTAGDCHGKARVGAADSCNLCRRGDTAETRRGATGGNECHDGCDRQSDAPVRRKSLHLFHRFTCPMPPNVYAERSQMLRISMLVGTELLTKVKELGDVSKSELVRSCGYVSSKKDGAERLNFTAFYEALLEAKGLHFGGGNGGGTGKGGRKLTYTATVQGNGNLLIGKAYTALLNLEPGDEFEIKLGRKQIRLVPAGAADEEE